MDGSGVGLEIEVKLRAIGREDATSRLARLPALLEEERRFEDNDVYDLPDGRLAKSESLLRLRVVETRAILTFKEKVSSDLNAKVRSEAQSQVASADAIRIIFDKLGLVRVYRYQKYRSYYGWIDPAGGGSLQLSLDETPIGVFLELEGPKLAIDHAAGLLGYGESDYIIEDYRSLHQEWLSQRGLPPCDMVFADAREPRAGG
jgi:adenylate cyclase, class 2